MQTSQILTLTDTIFSTFLGRDVKLSIILPVRFSPEIKYELLLINDGQDFPRLGMEKILEKLQNDELIRHILIVGIHANEYRIREYGTILQPDYANRGDRAASTRDFVLYELIPMLSEKYLLNETKHTYAGFSLGGLMALDIVWNHPELFDRAAIFSGSLWWRKRAINDGYNDADRIMHSQLRNSDKTPELKFWFQCGGRDETEDRDGDGVIDSVQDTLECIAELERKGYRWNEDIRYHEMRYGEHDPATWALAMPDFLKWAFGNS